MVMGVSFISEMHEYKSGGPCSMIERTMKLIIVANDSVVGLTMKSNMLLMEPLQYNL